MENTMTMSKSYEQKLLERRSQLFEQAPGEEAVEKREESVKHFRLGPGRYQAVVYAEPVHYKEEGSSAWKEIDNNLDDGTNEAGQPILRNRANKLRVELSKSADSGKLARIEEGGRVLEWSLDGMPAAVAPVVRQGAAIKQARLVERAQATPLFVGRTRASLEAADLSVLETEAEKRGDLTEKMDSDATYANVLPGLSVRYTLHGQSLKEDLILANAAALSYAALRLPDTYNYAVQENNSVSVRDKETGEEYFVFDPPLVYDAQGNETMAAVTLTPVSDGVRMSYALDEAFLAQAVFPVTIDPVTHSTSANKNTEFSCIAEGQSLHYDQNNDDIKVGTFEGRKCVGMLRYLKLAPLESSDTILQAQLCMYPKSSSTSKYIGVYPINKDWDKMTVNWANFDPYDEENIGQDAIECQKGSSSSPIVFDVTNLYRRWCMLDEDGNSQNFGVAFHTPLNIPAPNLSLLYSSVASSSRQPVMYLYYVSHAGLENWWQYESRSAGRAGTVYADLFNGNMVLAHTDTTMTGNRMPVSVSHYYNSCTSNANDHACGKGWKTSAHQKITKESLNGTDYFVWEDGDGTEHYFAETGSQPYKDQEGMDLELNLYESDGYIIIRDKGDNRMRFNILEPGLAWLVAERDALNNEVNYTYVGGYEKQGRISKITDPAGRETVFTYSGDLLANIRIPDTEENAYRYVYFTYDSSDRLTGIRYSELGGTTPHTVYTYDGTTGILTRAKNYDGIRVDIGYEAKSRYNNTIFDEGANDQMRRVTSLETVHVNAANAVTRSGAKQLFDYQHMCTVVTAVENTTSDAGKKLYYQFNDSGNVVAMRDELGFGHFTKYEAGVDNKPSEVSKLRRAVVNQLRKIDFSSQWTSSEGATRDTSVLCLGMPSVKLGGSWSGESYYQQEVTLLPNQKYTLSAYVKTQNVSISPTSAGARVCLKNQSGLTEAESDGVTGTTPEAVGNGMPTDGWQRVSLTFDHNASTEETYIVQLVSEGGTAWFSCPQLETGTVANSVNLLSNADFHVTTTSGEQTLPADWSKSSNDLDTEPTGVKPASTDPDFPEALEGNYVQVEGRPDMTQYVGFAQELDISGKKNDVLVCGGWASAHSVPNADTVERGFGIAIQLQNAGGEWSSYAMRPFNSEWVGWQYASHPLVVPGDFVKLRFIILYTSNCNYAKFTNLYLHREQFGISYGYSGTDRRNVVSTTNLAGMQAHMKYDGEDNLTRYVQPGRENVEANEYVKWYGDSATEQAKHLLLRERTPEKVVNYYDYDSYGNRTSTRRVDYRVTTNNTEETAYPYIRSEQAYTTDGNFAQTAKDARGNTVTRDTNTRTGELNSVTDPTGQTVSYTYDDAKRVTGVQTTADGKTYKNAYTYEEDRIKTVSHNTTSNTATDVTYTFNYDDLGRKTTVKVGTQTLSTNVYENDRNGLLKEVQYGNGGKVKYTYDDFDRLTGVRHDAETSDRYTYEYGANGQAARVHDNNLGRVYETEYDLSERPCRSTLREDYGALIYRTTLEYTRHSNLDNFREEVVVNNWQTDTYKTSYTYDIDNRVTEMQFETDLEFDDDTHKVAYEYDELGRIAGRALTNGSSAYDTTYTFIAGGYGTNSTTPLIAGISQGSGDNAMNFAYAYDSRGNITSETRNGKVTTYTYDALGQLIRVNDPNDSTAGSTGTTWVYNYDRGGNITSKSYHAYTTGTPGAAIDTIAYSYTDSNWKDKLTSYDGKAITYDAIGNPLTFGRYAYEWQKGRQLKKVTIKADLTEGTQAGVDEQSNTRLEIEWSNGNLISGSVTSTQASAKVTLDGEDVTDSYAASAFDWQRDSGNASVDASWNAAHKGKKAITLTAADLSGDVTISCTLTGEGGGYGSITVDDNMDAHHTPGVLDANDTFAIENGHLMVTTARGNVYSLVNGEVHGTGATLNGSITAQSRLFASQPEETVEFKYDHNGLRTQKKLIHADNTVLITNYTLHGKLITHLTRGGDKMHFYYDAQGRPAMVNFNTGFYSYVHNLQGDIVGIIDSKGELVVEYQYDAWGKPVFVRTLTTAYETLAEMNPFRYRGYVYDEETGLYYLKSRYYFAEQMRFVNNDGIFSLWGGVTKLNGYAYCVNSPLILYDPSGCAFVDILNEYRERVEEIIEDLENAWEFLHEFMYKTAKSHIPQILDDNPYIPRNVVPKITQSVRTITAEELASERRTRQLISQFEGAGFLTDIQDWMSADDVQLNPGLHGIITYEFTWSVVDGGGDSHTYYAIVENRYTLNADPNTFMENPAICDFVVVDSCLPEYGNMALPITEVY